MNKDETLAQTKQEPVAWCNPKEVWQLKNGRGYFIVMPEKNRVYSKPLYTTPQTKEWVGLTDDDRIIIKHDANFNQFMTAGEYAERAQQLTEARLKDLNK